MWRLLPIIGRVTNELGEWNPIPGVLSHEGWVIFSCDSRYLHSTGLWLDIWGPNPQPRILEAILHLRVLTPWPRVLEATLQPTVSIWWLTSLLSYAHKVVICPPPLNTNTGSMGISKQQGKHGRSNAVTVLCTNYTNSYQQREGESHELFIFI